MSADYFMRILFLVLLRCLWL